MLRDKKGRFVGGIPDNMQDPKSGRYCCILVPIESRVDKILQTHK